MGQLCSCHRAQRTWSSGNLFAVWINHYRKLTGLSVILLNALLVMDSAFLISMIFMYSPRGHLPRLFSVLDCADGHSDFWNSIDWAQRSYVITHPIMDLARLMVVWFTMAYVFEQYGALFHQERLVSFSKVKAAGMKTIVVIFNVAVITSLIHFFKFVRKEALYGAVEHLKVCLSDVYTAPAYTNYDIYLYFGAFVLLPWCLILIASIRMGVEFWNEKRRPNHPSRLDMPITLVMKEARSKAIVMATAVSFLLCYCVICVLYILTVEKSGILQSGVPCYLVPMDWRFSVMENGQMLEVVSISLHLLYSSTKLPMCYLVSRTFRRALHKRMQHIYFLVSTCFTNFGKLFYPHVDTRQRLIRERRMNTHPVKEKAQVAIVSYDNEAFHTNKRHQNSGQCERQQTIATPKHGRQGERMRQKEDDLVKHHTAARRPNETRKKEPAGSKCQSQVYRDWNKRRSYISGHPNQRSTVWESNV